MPTRIIRDGCLESERIDALSLGAEVFYKRLWHVVDDFGRYEYAPVVLLSKAFPRRAREYTEKQIEQWMRECITPIRADVNPLVFIYSVGGKMYLQLTDFRQRVRPGTESRWPAPNGDIISLADGSPLFAEFSGEKPRDSATRARTPSHTPSAPTPATPPTPAAEPIQQSEPVQATLSEEFTVPEPELFHGLLFAAHQAHMLVAEGQIPEIRDKFGQYTLVERRAAIDGIALRLQTGEYDPTDAHFIPSLHKYIFKKLWTAVLRPAPRNKSPIAIDRRTKGLEDFRKRMARETTGTAKGQMITDGTS